MAHKLVEGPAPAYLYCTPQVVFLPHAPSCPRAFVSATPGAWNVPPSSPHQTSVLHSGHGAAVSSVGSSNVADTLFPLLLTLPYFSKARLTLNMGCGSELLHPCCPRGPLSTLGLRALETGPVQVRMQLYVSNALHISMT